MSYQYNQKGCSAPRQRVVVIQHFMFDEDLIAVVILSDITNSSNIPHSASAWGRVSRIPLNLCLADDFPALQL